MGEKQNRDLEHLRLHRLQTLQLHHPPNPRLKTIDFRVWVAGTARILSWTPPASFDITQWHHYAGTYDGTTARFYVDGTQRATLLTTGIAAPDTGPLHIGRDDDWPRNGSAYIDEVAIYPTALPPPASSSTPKAEPPAPAPPAPTSPAPPTPPTPPPPQTPTPPSASASPQPTAPAAQPPPTPTKPPPSPPNPTTPQRTERCLTIRGLGRACVFGRCGARGPARELIGLASGGTVVRQRGDVRLRGVAARRGGVFASALVTGAMFALLTVGLAMSGGSATASGPAVVVEVVRTNDDFLTYAVDSTGVTYGVSESDDHGIWRSLDQGATWTKVLTLTGTRRVTNISALSSGTVLAHIDIGSMTMYRSPDHGDTWTPVLSLPTSPVFNTTLTPSSVTDGDGHVWVGTYNISDPSQKYTNQIYRSDDDGATFTSVNSTTTHRHIHGLRYNTANHRLYVFFGDSPGDGVWQSSDNGATLQPLCTVYECVTIDGAFGEDANGGFIVFGQDNYANQNHIVKVSLETGELTNVLDLPYDSFSTYRLNPTTYLVGTTHEGPDLPITDPNLHLYVSTDGVATGFVDAFQRPIPYPNGRVDLQVQFSYPNGDFPIQIDGYGTIIARLITAPPTPPRPW